MLKIEARGKKGIFQIVGKIRGQRVHQSTGTTSRAHAEAERIKLEKQILDADIYGRRSTATFAEAVEAYLDSGGSSRFLARLNGHFGRWLIGNISQAEVVKFHKLHYPKASAQTLNREVFTPLIAVWRAAHRARLCGPHEFQRPRQPETRPVKYATDDMLAKLLPVCGFRLKAAILFVSFTAARASEACRLTSADVDWESRTVLLQKTKSGHPRMVALSPMLYSALLPLKGTEGPLFGFGQRWSLNQALARACKRAGVPILTSHKIGRHAFAARLLKAGKTLKEVQEAGGWSSMSMGMLAGTYGHLEQSAVDQIVRDADQELAGIVKKRSRPKRVA